MVQDQRIKIEVKSYLKLKSWLLFESNTTFNFNFISLYSFQAEDEIKNQFYN